MCALRVLPPENAAARAGGGAPDVHGAGHGHCRSGAGGDACESEGALHFLLVFGLLLRTNKFPKCTEFNLVARESRTTRRPAMDHAGSQGLAGPPGGGEVPPDDLYLKLNKQRRALEMLAIQVRSPPSYQFAARPCSCASPARSRHNRIRRRIHEEEDTCMSGTLMTQQQLLERDRRERR